MSKEQEKQLHKTVSTLLRQVPPPMSPCKETTLQDSPERADPLRLGAVVRDGDHGRQLHPTQLAAASHNTHVSDPVLLLSLCGGLFVSNGVGVRSLCMAPTPIAHLQCASYGPPATTTNVLSHVALLHRRRLEFSQGLEQFRQLAGSFSSMQVPTALLK